MKKLIFLLFFLFFGINIFAQEFDIQWLNNMSNFLRKQVRDIPDEYILNPDNRALYERNLSNNIREGFLVQNNIIIGVMWGKKYSSRSTLYSEYDNYKALLINRIGRVIFNFDGTDVFNWNSKMLILVVEDNEIMIVLALPEGRGMSQYLWEQIINNLDEYLNENQ